MAHGDWIPTREADKGKSVYYAACYENAKGHAGLWSPVEEGVVG